MVNKSFIRPAISWGVGIGLVAPLDFPMSSQHLVFSRPRAGRNSSRKKIIGSNFYMMKSLPCMGKLADPTPFFGILFQKVPPTSKQHRCQAWEVERCLRMCQAWCGPNTLASRWVNLPSNATAVNSGRGVGDFLNAQKIRPLFGRNNG